MERKNCRKTTALITALMPVLLLTIIVYPICYDGFYPPDPRYAIQEPYRYPVRPGSDEWIALENTQARRNASDIEEDIVKNMSTMALVRSVIDYPFLIDIFAFSSPAGGIEAVAGRFTGMPELLSRPDAENCLQKFMQSRAAVRFLSPAATLDYTAANTLLNYLKQTHELK